MALKPEVSVIMANYNGGRYLGAAIKSLQMQSLKQWELILVDDASGDESLERAESFARGDKRIRIVTQGANRGPAAARNEALAIARGRWISVFDSDDIMRPLRLETLRDRALKDNAAIVADDLLIFSDADRMPRPFLPKKFTATPRWIGLAQYVDSNRLYSRVPDLGYLKPFIETDLLRRTGIQYDERLRIGEDYEIMARLLAVGARLRLEPTANYLYRKHPASISHRIHSAHIEALLDADERLVESLGKLRPDVARAFKRRKDSLCAMLSYDRIVMLIKAGQYAKASASIAAQPRTWPLLGRPVRARLERFFGQNGEFAGSPGPRRQARIEAL